MYVRQKHKRRKVDRKIKVIDNNSDSGSGSDSESDECTKSKDKTMISIKNNRILFYGDVTRKSCFELINAFEKACGKSIPYKIVPRREGDLAEYYADASLALNILGWKTEYDLQTMVEDTWRWQSKIPEGYNGE